MSDNSNADQAKLRATFDQAGAGMRDMAGPLWSFYDGLRKEGFRDTEALDIVKSWLTTVLMISLKPPQV